MVLGNSTEICGGPSRMTMFNYTLGWAPPTLPTGWSSIGCWTDAGSTRALGSYSFTSSSMTRELCMSTCLAKGYAFAGAEYSTECYCANSFALSSTSGATGCTMTCGGNTTETCGGPNRLTAYNYTLGIATTTAISAAAATSTALNVAVPRGLVIQRLQDRGDVHARIEQRIPLIKLNDQRILHDLVSEARLHPRRDRVLWRVFLRERVQCR
jgi:hypothetical protein